MDEFALRIRKTCDQAGKNSSLQTVWVKEGGVTRRVKGSTFSVDKGGDVLRADGHAIAALFTDALMGWVCKGTQVKHLPVG